MDRLKLVAILGLKLLMLAAFWVPSAIYAQFSAKEDSLLQVLESLPEDSNRVNLLNELFKASLSKSFDRAIRYETDALNLANKIKYRNGIAKATNNLGAVYTRLGRFNLALEFYDQYYEMEKAVNSRRGMATALNNMGSAHHQMGNYSTARRFYEQARPLMEELKDTAALLGLLNNIGSCFQEQGNFPEALEYFMEAIQGWEKLGDEKGLAMPIGNAGNVYLRQNQDSLAETYFKRAMDIYEKNNEYFGKVHILGNFGAAYVDRNELSKAREYYLRASQLSKSIGYIHGEASSLNSLAEIDLKDNKLDSVEHQFRQVLAWYESSGNKIGASTAHHNLGLYYLKLKQYKKALPLFEESLDTCRVTGSLARIADNFNGMAQAYSGLGQYKQAFNCLDSFVVFKDSVFNKERSVQIAEILQRYAIQKQEQKINELALENAKYELDAERGRTLQLYLVGGITVLLIVAVLFILLFWQISKSNKAIARKNQEIQAQRDLVEQQNRQIREINLGLEKVVEERTRNLVEVNRELDAFLYESAHALRRPITSVRGLMELLRMAKEPGEIDNLRGNIHFTLSRMDGMLHKLILVNENGRRPVMLGKAKLYSLVSDAARNLDRTDADFEIHVPPGLEVNCDEARLRTLLGQLLENAFQFRSQIPGLRHKVWVDAALAGDQLQLKISDNGMGIQAEQQARIFDMFMRGTERSQGNGLGLYVVKKIVDKLAGEIRVDSIPDKQTTFTVLLPTK